MTTKNDQPKKNPPRQPAVNGSATHASAPQAPTPDDVLYSGEDFDTHTGIERMVSPYPAENQPQIAQTFKQLIDSFGKNIPPIYDIPKNNLATGFTIILAGGYAAYTNQTFPDDAIKPLFRQVEQVMRNNPSLTHLSMDEKNAMYQVWIGTGMYMLGWQSELAKRPNPPQQAQMRQAGANIMRSLDVDPDHVRFTASGMGPR